MKTKKSKIFVFAFLSLITITSILICSLFFIKTKNKNNSNITNNLNSSQLYLNNLNPNEKLISSGTISSDFNSFGNKTKFNFKTNGNNSINLDFKFKNNTTNIPFTNKKFKINSQFHIDQQENWCNWTSNLVSPISTNIKTLEYDSNFYSNRTSTTIKKQLEKLCDESIVENVWIQKDTNKWNNGMPIPVKNMWGGPIFHPYKHECIPQSMCYTYNPTNFWKRWTLPGHNYEHLWSATGPANIYVTNWWNQGYVPTEGRDKNIVKQTFKNGIKVSEFSYELASCYLKNFSISFNENKYTFPTSAKTASGGTTDAFISFFDNTYEKQGDYNQYYNSDYYDANRSYNMQSLGISNTNTNLQNIWVDFSNLISVNTSKTSNYLDQNNNVWKSTPKIYFDWNIDLFDALWKAAKISNIVYDIWFNWNEISSFSAFAKTQFTNLINDIFNQKVDLNVLTNFIDQVKKSNGSNCYYQQSNSDAKYSLTLKKYNWNLNPQYYTNPISYLGENLVFSKILNYSLPYEYILPQIFKNDIYTYIKITGNDNLITNQNVTKIYDGKTKSWTPINVINYGQQNQLLNNNVDVIIKDVYMYNPDQGTIAGSTSLFNNTLNIRNINNVSEQNYKNNIKWDTAENGIKFSFAFNPNLNQSNISQENLKSVFFKNEYPFSEIAAVPNDSTLLDKIKYQNATKNYLQIPDDIIQSTGGFTVVNESKKLYNYKIFDPNDSFVLQDILKLNIDDLAFKDKNQFKKFFKYYNDYLLQFDLFQNNKITTQEFYDAKAKIDNLGYYYLPVNLKCSIDFFVPPGTYQKMISEETLIPLGTKKPFDTLYFKYLIKFSTDLRPLDYKKLENYVNVSHPTPPGFEEEKKLKNLENNFRTSNIELSSEINNLVAINNYVQNLLNEFKKLEKYIDENFNLILNKNIEIKNKLNKINEEYDYKINHLIDELKNRYNIFLNNSNYEGSGFFQKINDVFEYKNDLQQLLFFYNNKQKEILNLLDNQNFYIEFKNQIQNYINQFLNLINDKKNLLSNSIKKINFLYQKITDIKTQLSTIETLTYNNKIKIEFDLNKILNDSKNPYSVWTEFVVHQRILPDIFYVTTENFAKKLNSIIKNKYDVDIYFNQFSLDFNFVSYQDKKSIEYKISINQTEQWQSYWLEFDENQDGILTKYDYYVLLSNTMLLNKDSKNSKNYVSTITPTIKNDFDKTKQNINNFKNNINAILEKIKTYNLLISKTNNIIDDLNNNLNNLKNWQPFSNEKLFSEINSCIENYQSIQNNKTKINPIWLSLIIIISSVALISFIGTLIYFKSKKNRFKKTIELTESEKNEYQNISEKKGE